MYYRLPDNCGGSPSNTRLSHSAGAMVGQRRSAGAMVGQRRRRWPTIAPALCDSLVFVDDSRHFLVLFAIYFLVPSDEQ